MGQADVIMSGTHAALLMHGAARWDACSGMAVADDAPVPAPLLPSLLRSDDGNGL